MRAIAVDIGGTHIRCGVVGEDGSVERVDTRPSNVRADADALLSSVAGVVNDSTHGMGSGVALGVAIPGLSDSSGRVIEHCANLPGLRGVDVVGRLAELTGRRVHLLADVNAAALAESRFGAGRNVSRLIVGAVGTGVGAAVMLDGRLVQHTHGLGGSLGHLIINPTGPRCGCGARGCIEALAAGPAVLEAVKRHAGSDWLATHAGDDNGGGVWAAIGDALADPSSAVASAVEETGRWLGVGIANWAVIYDPDRVVLAGGLVSLGQRWLAAVRRGFEAGAASFYRRGLEIVPAHYPKSAALIGAGLHALGESEHMEAGG